MIDIDKCLDRIRGMACEEELAGWIYWYVFGVLKKRWKKGEKIILTSPRYTYLYALYVLKKRWKKGEKIND